MKYRDDKNRIIRKDDTTIVYGEGLPSYEFARRFQEGIDKISYLEDGMDYLSPIFVKGVTHKDPKDDYDEALGIKVASRKAELKARNKMFHNLSRVRKKLIELQELVLDEMMHEARRVDTILLELEEIRNK